MFLSNLWIYRGVGAITVHQFLVSVDSSFCTMSWVQFVYLTHSFKLETCRWQSEGVQNPISMPLLITTNVIGTVVQWQSSCNRSSIITIFIELEIILLIGMAIWNTDLILHIFLAAYKVRDFKFIKEIII